MHYEKFSKKQHTALTWWRQKQLCGYDAIICDGAIRSGKTLSMALGFLLWAMASYRGQRFALCGKTISSLRRNVVELLPHWLEGIFSCQEKRSENLLILRDAQGRENYFYLFGGRDEGSAALIQGMTLSGVLLDEVALMPRSFVEQAVARCSIEGSRFWFNCNPEGPEHWFYREWICQAQARNALHLRFTMRDNLSLGEGVRARYERLYRGVFYRRFILGEWCLAEGLVYEFSPERHVLSKLPRPTAQTRYYISCDYGTMNPFSAGLWAVQGGKAYRMAEYYYDGRKSGRQKTDAEYYEALLDLAAGRAIDCVVVDPSASSFITLIVQKGELAVKKARNSLRDGIRAVAQRLQDGSLFLHESCVDGIREFALYRWDETSAEEKPRKEHDHAMDEIRYFVTTILPTLRVEKKKATPPPKPAFALEQQRGFSLGEGERMSVL